MKELTRKKERKKDCKQAVWGQGKSDWRIKMSKLISETKVARCMEPWSFNIRKLKLYFRSYPLDHNSHHLP